MFATMLEIVLLRRILQGMTTTTTMSKAMAIKGTTGSKIKERGMLPMLDMEMVDLPKGREISGMTASPLDTLDHWLIDYGASRHFTGYKEALLNLVEKKTNLEIILGDNVTYLVKGIGTVSLT